MTYTEARRSYQSDPGYQHWVDDLIAQVMVRLGSEDPQVRAVVSRLVRTGEVFVLRRRGRVVFLEPHTVDVVVRLDAPHRYIVRPDWSQTPDLMLTESDICHAVLPTQGVRGRPAVDADGGVNVAIYRIVEEVGRVVDWLSRANP